MRNAVLALIVFMVAAGLLAWQAPLQPGLAQGSTPIVDRTEIPASTDEQFATRQIVVRLEGNASSAAVESLNDRFGATTIEVEPRSGLRRIALPQGVDIDDAIAAYEADPRVTEASRSRVMRATGGPNDSNYSYQWNMHDTVGGVWAKSAWNIATSGGNGVVVAVIDTGVAYESHTGPG
ncbi:MAG: hypothetical protein WBD55_11815, partial [Dehalococcoidia bacterium]